MKNQNTLSVVAGQIDAWFMAVSFRNCATCMHDNALWSENLSDSCKKEQELEARLGYPHSGSSSCEYHCRVPGCDDE